MHSTDLFSYRHDLSLKNLISKKLLESLVTESTRFRVFDPAVTLHLFLYQVLKRTSCKGVLAYFNVLRTKKRQPLVSLNSSAYTKAKQRLNEDTIRKIAVDSGEKLDHHSKKWRWNNQRAYLIDGTVLNMEDSQEIVSEYPHTYSKGIQQGQPKLRFLGAFGLASGAFLDGEIGKYSGKGQSETTLVRVLIKRLKSNSVLVLDRFFTSFFLQDIFLKNKFDYVIRGRDKSMMKLLGRSSDKIVTLKRPPIRAHQNYTIEGVLCEIRVRVIKSTIKRKGFRTSSIYIMTSFLDSKIYPKKEVEKLYLYRWNVELDIRHLKTSLEASLLRSKSPSMARKELWVSLLGFNLIRSINIMTALSSDGCSPRKLSFKTTLSYYLEIVSCLGVKSLNFFLDCLSKEKLNSKYRREPRALKKRSNRYPHLTKSRKESKNENWGYQRRAGRMGLSVIEVS